MTSYIDQKNPVNILVHHFTPSATIEVVDSLRLVSFFINFTML